MRKRQRTLRLLACVLALFFSCVARGETLTSIHVNQTVQAKDELFVMFTVTNEKGDVVDTVQEKEVTVSIGTKKASPELTTVMQSNMGVAYVFAVDISKSLKAKQFDALRNAMHNWIHTLGEKDAAAIMTFGEEISLLTDFTNDKAQLSALVDGLSPTDMKTQLYDGIIKALDLARRQQETLPPLRALVVLSDGIDDYPAGAAVSEVTEQAKQGATPIYVVGIMNQNNSSALSELGGIARVSGGDLVGVGANALESGYQEIQNRIAASYIAKIQLPADLKNGGTQEATVAVEQAGIRIEDHFSAWINAWEVKPEATAEAKPQATAVPSATPAPTAVLPKIPLPDTDTLMLLAGLCIGLLAIGAAVLLLIRRSRNKKERQEAERAAARHSMREFERAIRPDTSDLTGGLTGPVGATQKLDPGDDSTTLLSQSSTPGIVLTLINEATGVSQSAPLKRSVQVGRKTDKNAIIVEDRAVSGEHCVFLMENDKLYLRDLNSSNGTFVMERGRYRSVDSSTGTQVKNGDRIRLGQTELTIELKKQ